MIDATALLSLVRALPDAKLAAFTRGLKDEDLFALVRGVFLGAIDATLATPAPVARKQKKPKKPKPRPRKSTVAPVDTENETEGASISIVAKAILGADGISKSEIVNVTELPEHAVGHALRVLKLQGRAFLGGRARAARWAITQDAADEAAACARGTRA